MVGRQVLLLKAGWSPGVRYISMALARQSWQLYTRLGRLFCQAKVGGRRVHVIAESQGYV